MAQLVQRTTSGWDGHLRFDDLGRMRQPWRPQEDLAKVQLGLIPTLGRNLAVQPAPSPIHTDATHPHTYAHSYACAHAPNTQRHKTTTAITIPITLGLSLRRARVKTCVERHGSSVVCGPYVGDRRIGLAVHGGRARLIHEPLFRTAHLQHSEM